MSNTIKIVTQNCNLSLSVKHIRELLHKYSADVYCLQEIMGKETLNKITKDTTYQAVKSMPVKVLKIAKLHNAVVTTAEVVESGYIKFGKKEGHVVMWAVLNKGEKMIKIYNCHLGPYKTGMEKRKMIVEQILEDALRFNGPVVICGDFNTTIPNSSAQRKIAKIWLRFPNPDKTKLGVYAQRSEKHLIHDTAKSYGFTEVADIFQNTWRMPVINKEIFNIKTDWMLYKGALCVNHEFGPWIGDHRSIIGELSF